MELEAVAEAIRKLDPAGGRIAQVLRDTFDQLYDGQRTGMAIDKAAGKHRRPCETVRIRWL
jgi:hypothetical protein